MVRINKHTVVKTQTESHVRCDGMKMRTGAPLSVVVALKHFTTVPVPQTCTGHAVI